VALVDDANRHEQHSRANVERAGQQEVDIRLLEFQLALLFQTLDDSVLELQLADEPDLFREGVCDQQDEAMEIQLGVAELGLLK
jgi:hypothetical protein